MARSDSLHLPTWFEMVSQAESFSKVLTFKCTRLMQLALDSTDTFTSTRFIGQISALKFINPIAEFKLQYDYFRDLEKKPFQSF